MSLGQIFKKKLDFLDKIFSKKTIIFINQKVIGIPRWIKQGEYRQWPKKF